LTTAIEQAKKKRPITDFEEPEFEAAAPPPEEEGPEDDDLTEDEDEDQEGDEPDADEAEAEEAEAQAAPARSEGRTKMKGKAATKPAPARGGAARRPAAPTRGAAARRPTPKQQPAARATSGAGNASKPHVNNRPAKAANRVRGQGAPALIVAAMIKNPKISAAELKEMLVKNKNPASMDSVASIRGRTMTAFRMLDEAGHLKGLKLD